MDVRISSPAEQAEAFKASLFDFLEGLRQAGLDGFAVHRAEPDGEGLVQHVYFESDQAAREFQSRWSGALSR
jgi:hypothetical protein